MQGIFIWYSLLWTLYFIQGKRTRVLLFYWSRIWNRNFTHQINTPTKPLQRFSLIAQQRIREERILTLNEECQRTSCQNFLAPSRTTWPGRFEDCFSSCVATGERTNFSFPNPSFSRRQAKKRAEGPVHTSTFSQGGPEIPQKYSEIQLRAF